VRAWQCVHANECVLCINERDSLPFLLDSKYYTILFAYTSRLSCECVIGFTGIWSWVWFPSCIGVEQQRSMHLQLALHMDKKNIKFYNFFRNNN